MGPQGMPGIPGLDGCNGTDVCIMYSSYFENIEIKKIIIL